jgi:ribonuclease HI
MVGPKVKMEVISVLNGGTMPEGWNETTIVLIPKVKDPERVTEFRPISLCNVLYKIISKVLANRLKIILPHIISPTQSAFVPGRLITDNVLLAYEITHMMHRRKGGRDGLVAVKLDMSKAYDRVEWSFLEGMMAKMGFEQAWIDLVMKCVRSVKYRVKVNRNLMEPFTPERGLRQGDPLSPYLFILCAEGLSVLLKKANEKGDIEGVRLCPGAPSINHLFFADDSLIVMKANARNAESLQQVLALYEASSGQMLNATKSSAMFSKGTTRGAKRTVLNILGIPRESRNERYLGLPVHLGASKAKEFEYLKEKIWQCIQGWKEKLLSKAGKEILIKAIAQAIPTYAMSCFDLTKTFCDEVSAIICRFWWDQQEGKNKCHWVSWECLTRAKQDGGLRFRDLHVFNLAMLARQSWRLLQNPDSLCCEVLKAMYFPDTTILEAKPKPGMSYSWRSILQGLQLLKEGVIWRVGTGEHIKVWTDPWTPRGRTRRPCTPDGLGEDLKVEDLIDPMSNQWDLEVLQGLFYEEDVKDIMKIPICRGMEDHVAWHPDKKGLFSVKSAYHLGMSLKAHKRGVASSSGTIQEIDPLWKQLWRMKLPGKVKIFLWRLARNSLPTRMNISRKKIELDTRCPMCYRMNEDGGHLFLKCKKAKHVWRALFLEDVRVSILEAQDPMEVLRRVLALPGKRRNMTLLLLWNWWTTRNKANAGELMRSTDQVCHVIQKHWCEFDLEGEKVQSETPTTRTGDYSSSGWKRPRENFTKVNFDAAFHHPTEAGAWGFVARTDEGEFIAAAAGKLRHLHDALQAETEACAAAVEGAAALGLNRVIFESDSQVLVNALNSSSHELATIGVLLRDIRSNCIKDFEAFEFSFVSRTCNKVAHSLAKLGYEGEDECVGWADDPPQCVSVMVTSELAASSG